MECQCPIVTFSCFLVPSSHVGLIVTFMIRYLQTSTFRTASWGSDRDSSVAALTPSIKHMHGLPLSLVPSTIPSKIDFSRLSCSAPMMCPKYDSFCFSISASNIHGGLNNSSTVSFMEIPAHSLASSWFVLSHLYLSRFLSILTLLFSPTLITIY